VTYVRPQPVVRVIHRSLGDDEGDHEAEGPGGFDD
jgi:hypothetical protein